MKIICKLNDKIVLNQEGFSIKSPRITARAIVKNPNGLFAVMYSEKFNLYSLPGGGVEIGEDIIGALKREILEETGCTCDDIRELGIVYENRACHDFTQKNHYFAVTTYHIPASTSLTEKELENKTEVQWHSFKDMLSLISSANHSTEQRKYIQARDMAAINEFKNTFCIE